jgi:hypothetical protein
MDTTQETLRTLNFHDSEILRVDLSFTPRRGRSGVLDLNYYDWEGNAARRQNEPHAPWQWRTLRIDFAYLAVFEYSAEDLVNAPNEIATVEWDHGVAPLVAREEALAKQFTGYKSPLLVDPARLVSMKFLTQNYSETKEGYFLFIGVDVKTVWDAFPAPHGQIHVPIKSD